MRSARPRGEDGPKPERVMIAGGERRTEGPGETCPGEANSVLGGRREPAPCILKKVAQRDLARPSAKKDFFLVE
jgi:hypothetical protein